MDVFQIMLEKVDDMETGSTARIREKQLILKSNISDHDIEIHAKKIKSWLKKGYFINVTIKAGKDGHKSNDEVIKEIEEKCQEELEDRKGNLNFKK